MQLIIGSDFFMLVMDAKVTMWNEAAFHRVQNPSTITYSSIVGCSIEAR